MLSHKYCNDVTRRLTQFAQVGGIPAKEMISLEAEFLKVLDYRMFVDEKTFKMYHISVINYGKSLEKKK